MTPVAPWLMIALIYGQQNANIVRPMPSEEICKTKAEQIVEAFKRNDKFKGTEIDITCAKNEE